MGNNSNLTKMAKVVSFNPTGEFYFTKGIKAFQRRELYRAKKWIRKNFEDEYKNL